MNPNESEARESAGMSRELEQVQMALSQMVRQVPGPVSHMQIKHGHTEISVQWQPGQHAYDLPTRHTEELPEDEPQIDLDVVRAPLVGVFYAAPSPGAAPFVTTGETVSAGQQVGIIEAMKLMNAVVAPRAGRIEEILVTDGTGVEFDQVILTIDPREDGTDV